MPTDRASILHRRAVRYFRAGNSQRWIACLAARHIVGHYDEGATAALASDLCLSVSAVYYLADAGKAYVTYRKFGNVSELRRRLTTSHFSTIWRLQDKYGFDDFQAIGYLSEASEYGASVASMRASVDGIYSTKGTLFKAEGIIESSDYRNGGVAFIVFCQDCGDAPEVGSAVRIVEAKRRIEMVA